MCLFVIWIWLCVRVCVDMDNTYVHSDSRVLCGCCWCFSHHEMQSTLNGRTANTTQPDHLQKPESTRVIIRSPYCQLCGCLHCLKSEVHKKNRRRQHIIGSVCTVRPPANSCHIVLPKGVASHPVKPIPFVLHQLQWLQVIIVIHPPKRSRRSN